jgi:hypothetical protein
MFAVNRRYLGTSLRDSGYVRRKKDKVENIVDYTGAEDDGFS